MLNQDLITLLGEMPPDEELAISVNFIGHRRQTAVTYDIGYDMNEYGELILRVQVETGNTNDNTSLQQY